MVDKRNSPLEARSESEAVRTRHEVQDGKNDSCCLLLLALSPQFAVSVMWIGYVIVCFSGSMFAEFTCVLSVTLLTHNRSPPRNVYESVSGSPSLKTSSRVGKLHGY